MISGRADSYKGFIHSKKVYLKRKKHLNRETNRAKKFRKACKSKFNKRVYKNIISKGKDDIYILRIMYNLEKRENRFKSQFLEIVN